MIKRGITRILLATALVAAVPATAGAQDADTAPEGVDWHLSSYAVDGQLAVVPWQVDPTLRLEDGTASGSGGCNTFSGSYALEGETLTVDATLAMTLMACPDLATEVEDAYLGLLPRTATWAITDDALTLSDELGDPLLTFERSVVALTPSDLAAIAARLDALQAGIDRTDGRVDDIRIGTLRERIKELEGSVAALRAAQSASAGAGTTYTAAEGTLLKAVPSKTRQTCKPLRRRLPAGTVAALSCKPTSSVVASQAYYLMEYDDAVATMRSVAGASGVPERRPRCHAQRSGWVDLGEPVGAEACWVEDGKANVRLVAQAASCHELDAGSTHLTEPVVYLALEGKGRRMEPVRAAGLAYTDADIYLLNFEAARPIPHGGQPLTPACQAHRS